MKTYKGLDLVKAVANYEITQGTKLKCIHPVYRQGIEVNENKLIWSDTKEPIRYPHFLDNQFEFEIIEEEKEIKEIEVENGHIVDYDETGKHYITTNRKDRNIYINKINELVSEIRKLKDKE